MKTLATGKTSAFNAELEAQARAWLVRLRSGEATQDDARAFRHWCTEHPEHARMALALSDTWNILQTAAGEFRQQTLLTDATHVARMGRDARSRGLRTGRRAFMGVAVAAGASWLALRPPLQLWPAVSELSVDYRTGTGEQRRVALSERVTVEMNTQTLINLLPAHGAQAAGLVQHGIDLLAGEAEIVAARPPKGGTASLRPVVVVAGRGRLRADIARFDVRRSGNRVCVTCVSGTVVVEHPRQEASLSANQQLIYDDHDLRLVSRVDTNAVTAWRKGLLVFNDVPLAQVVEEINRYRPGKLILRNAALGRRLVQAQFSIATLDDAVGMISNAYGAHVLRLPGHIVLLS